MGKIKKDLIGYYETELEAHNACSIYLKTGKKLMSEMAKNSRDKKKEKDREKKEEKNNVMVTEKILKKKRWVIYNYVPKPNLRVKYLFNGTMVLLL